MIGIYGGTFNPVHHGHLRIALEAQEIVGLDKVFWVPLNTPPHRDMPCVSAEKRKTMIELAIENHDGFQLDDRELRRDGPSYTRDTLASFRSEVGDEPICLLLGLDAFLGLLNWYHCRDIPEFAHIVVLCRPGSERPKEGVLADLIKMRETDDLDDLRNNPAGRIFFSPVTQLDISSTIIRQRMRANQCVRYLLPDSVIDYIRREKLYG